MKTIFKNKKYLALTIASVAVILTLIIAVPTVFALSDNSGEIVEKKSEQESVVENNEQENSTKQTEKVTVSTQNNNETPIDIISETDNIVENEEIENQLFKITDKTVVFGDLKFNFKESKYDEVIDKTVNIYRSKNLDQIMVDSQTNEIYSLYLFDDLYANSINANSSSENDLKLTAQKFAVKLCGNIERYNSNSVIKLDSGGYDVCFMRKINGYDTSEWITVGFDENLNIWSYRREPNVFDDIDISNISVNEDKIEQNIADVYKERYGENYGTFEIKHQQMTVKNSKIILETGTSALNKLGDPISQGAVDLFEFVVG